MTIPISRTPRPTAPTLPALAGLSGLLVVALAGPAAAQEGWSFDLRAGAAVPTADLVDDELGTGVGFEGTVAYRLLPHLSAYAGWDWMHFNPSESFAGPDLDIEETGYVFGLRFEHPFRGESGPGPGYWLRGGGTVGHLELEDDEGDVVGDTGHGLGWEVGGGVSLPLGAWRFTPGIRFRSLTRDLEIAAVTRDLELRYLTFEIGFGRSF